jgi:hypothetical protein
MGDETGDKDGLISRVDSIDSDNITHPESS